MNNMITHKDRMIILTVVLILLSLPILMLMIPASRPQSAGATESTVQTECPPANLEGAYFERGIDRDGNVICGFAYFNPCPYFDGVPADNPKCVAPTEEQMQPWISTETVVEQPTNNCEAK